MLLYNFATRQTVSLPLNKCNRVPVEITIGDEELMNYNIYCQTIKSRIGAALEGVELKENTLFEIKINGVFEDNEDFCDVAMQVQSELFRALGSNEPRGENRLRANCDNLFTTYCSLIKMINNKSKINCFGFQIVGNGNLIEMVVEE